MHVHACHVQLTSHFNHIWQYCFGGRKISNCSNKYNFGDVRQPSVHDFECFIKPNIMWLWLAKTCTCTRLFFPFIFWLFFSSQLRQIKPVCQLPVSMSNVDSNYILAYFHSYLELIEFFFLNDYSCLLQNMKKRMQKQAVWCIAYIQVTANN